MSLTFVRLKPVEYLMAEQELNRSKRVSKAGCGDEMLPQKGVENLRVEM